MAAKGLHGQFSKVITVTTNDPQKPTVTLTLKGEFKSFVEVTPATAFFGRVGDGVTPQERRLKVEAKTDAPVAITLPPPAPGKPFTYELVTKSPGREYELVVRMSPRKEVGPVMDTLSIATDHPKQKALEITANAQIVPRLEVQPAAINHSSDPSGKPSVYQVRLHNNGVKPVKVLAAAASAKEILATLKEEASGWNYTLNVEIPSGFVPNGSDSKVTLKTDDQEKPAIDIPVRPVSRPPERGSTSQLLGKPAPAFSFKTTAGKEVSNGSLKEITVLNFIAMDCPHCKRQLPRVEEVRKAYAGKPVRFVQVIQKMRREFAADDVIKQLAQLGFDPASAELAVDMANAAGTPFKISGYPALVVLGKGGKVEAANAGNSPGLESLLKGQLDALLAGRQVAPDPPKR